MMSTWCLTSSTLASTPVSLFSLSHSDLNFDQRLDLFWGGGGLAPSQRDTCITHTKVNYNLYVCLVGSLLDDILDPPSYMYRFEQSFARIKEWKHKGTPKPSAREAWKRRRKKTEQRKKVCKSSTTCPVRRTKLSNHRSSRTRGSLD